MDVDQEAAGDAWRGEVDLDEIELVLGELDPLLRAVAANGASMLIKVDGERTEGANPAVFTVVISGAPDGRGSVRCDDAELARGAVRALKLFDDAARTADNDNDPRPGTNRG